MYIHIQLGSPTSWGVQDFVDHEWDSCVGSKAKKPFKWNRLDPLSILFLTSTNACIYSPTYLTTHRNKSSLLGVSFFFLERERAFYFLELHNHYKDLTRSAFETEKKHLTSVYILEICFRWMKHLSTFLMNSSWCSVS